MHRLWAYLRRWQLRFPEPLETAFERDHAARSQHLIRQSFPLGALVLVVYGLADLWLFHRLDDLLLWITLGWLVFSTGAVGAWSWRERHPRRLLVIARAALATNGLTLGITIALAATLGNVEPRGLVTGHLLYVFFLTGLLTRSAIAIGLLTAGAYLGAKFWFEALDPAESERIVSFVAILLLGSIGARLHEVLHRERWQLQRHFAHRANHDDLTGLTSRHHFFEQADKRVGQARRDGKPLAMIMLDIDYFKRFNDSFGHVAGDACLRQVASQVSALAARPLDLAARYGGEELVLMLYDCPAAQAVRRAEILRGAIVALAIRHPSTPGGTVSASLGVHSSVPSSKDTVITLLNKADQQLYQAKQAGRNRVAMAAD